MCLIYFLLICLTMIYGTLLHENGDGKLVEPPGRTFVWKLNYTSSQKNQNDHRMNCGGFETHWLKNNGKCGVCGEPSQESNPIHRKGEDAHSNVISRTYLQNSIINITVETSSDLFGYFEFRICPYSKNKQVTQDCLNKNVLEIGDTGHNIYKVWYQGYHVIPLQLPVDLTCDQCLLQFKYHTGYRWGCDGDNCCYGCGPMQEEFYSCADIKILPDDTLKYHSITSKELSPYKTWWCIFQCVGEECSSKDCLKHAHLRSKRQTKTCLATGVWVGYAAMDNWCRTNCLSERPYCPESYCKCETEAVISTTTTTPQPTTASSRLQVSASPLELNASIGQGSVKIKCDVTGSPSAVTWYWLKIPFTVGFSSIIYQGTNNDDYTVEDFPSAPHLTIKSITQEDEADYMCVAVNTVGTSLSSKARLHIVEGSVPSIVRVMASAGCEYCKDKNNVTCSSWYCPEEYTSQLGLSGSLTSKVNQMADDFCSICQNNDTACQDLFCLPNRRMVPLAIKARCNLCSQQGIQCPADPECRVIDNALQSSSLTSNECRAVGDWEGQAGMDVWCQKNCPDPSTCPSSHCKCPGSLQTQRLNGLTCTGAGAWAGSTAMTDWCTRNCPGNCPSTHCSCQSTQVTSGMTTTATTTTTQRTTTNSIVISKDTDLYSANAMNGIMCSICKKNDSFSDCSKKYCELYNPNLEEPQDSLNRVFTFSPAIFCQLAVNEGNANLQALFCGGIFAKVLPEVQTVMCTACQEIGSGRNCESYCG